MNGTVPQKNLLLCYFFSVLPREPALLEAAPELREVDDCVPRDELEVDEEWPLSEPE